MNGRSIVNPNQIIRGNRGVLKIEKTELAELKNLEIKITPEIKEISLMDSITKGKIAVSYNGTITFELYKMYSRFKTSILASANDLYLMTFSLEAVVNSPDGKSEEHICIDKCWFEGDTVLLSLNSEGDVLTEKYTAGFAVNTVKFVDTIKDGYDWEYTNIYGKKV